MRPAETHAAITSPLGSAEQLFYAALEVPEAERAARLHTWCDGDRALEERVLALVRSDASVAERIKSVPVMHDAGAGVLDTTGAEAWQNRQLGKYRLTGLLGSGGMGDVYLAERLDSPGSQAAIKCIQQRLRDSPAVKHFLLERDSLAGLAHPNIARLLDGGVQEAGAPYLVMEYVAGERLDAVADRESTSIRDIVGLVAQLLDAVGYAHRHLIVHRDIKPGNVMVSEQGVVKLLDFGALKLLGNGEAQSQMTVAGMRPLTLRYSSPEHLRGAPVTTAADLYSLGVLLYRLVAGRLPEELDDGPTALWLDRLRNGKVKAPSELSEKAIDSGLASDLDAIVAKAMRFEPTDRYASAAAMRTDLERALANRPVKARGANRRYVLGRWLRRNRMGIAIGTAAGCVLAVGLLAMKAYAREAVAGQQRAERGVELERKLAHVLLFEYFDKLREVPGSTEAQKQMTGEAISFLNGLSASPAGDNDQVRLEQVRGYTTMGNVLGNPYEQNLDEPKAGIDALTRGLALARELARKHPNDLAVLRAEANAAHGLSNTYFGQGDTQNALATGSEAVSAGELLVLNPAATGADLAIVASIEDAQGDILGGVDSSALAHPEQASAAFERSLAYERGGVARDPTCARCRRGISVELYKLGFQDERDDPESAGHFYMQALANYRSLAPSEQASLRVIRQSGVVMERLGMIEVRIGQTASGLALLGEAVARAKKAADADPHNQQARFDLASTETNAAESEGDANLTRQSVATYADSLVNYDLLLANDAGNENWQYDRAFSLFRMGQQVSKTSLSTGLEEQRRALPVLLTLARHPRASVMELQTTIEALTATGGNPAEASTLADRMLALTDSPSVDALLIAATAKANAGEPAAAQRLAHQAADLLNEHHVVTQGQRTSLAEALRLLSSGGTTDRPAKAVAR
jgi:hypothetical protein